MRTRRSRIPKPRRVHYELIDRGSLLGYPMYLLLDKLVLAHHAELRDARLALAWCTSWKPDVDGRVTLGKCRKASDLDRELASFDFVILLSRSFWRHEDVTELQRTALLDHELTHASVKYDEKGEPARDERDRIVYRVRKHDLDEFSDIARRYGCWKKDLEDFAAALKRQPVGEFTPCAQCQDSPGWVPVVDLTNTARVTRCACWIRWHEQKELVSA